MINVAINGYGTIGKRVTDAVTAQDDMKIVGVTKTRPDFKARLAIEKGYKLYVAIPEKQDDFKKADINISGTIYDLLKQADIVVDCSPGGIGIKNKPKYEKAGIKAIFEGGEKSEVADVSFNAICNYKKAIGCRFVRVVSCNTTGLCRVIYPLDKAFGIEKARVILVRRAVDPPDIKKGPINAIIPDPVKLPSHHGPDVQTVLPHINITTLAIKVPTTLMHLHILNIKFKNTPTADDVKDVLKKTTRIRFVKASDELTSTASIVELGRDLGRPRYDMWENCVWEDSISINDGELYFFQAIHQEADPIPENIDAIRAMMELEKDANKSIQKTNKALGIE
jgi:glyceraldehyde-3-phosphate dehydrogenase (NAD(P))